MKGNPNKAAEMAAEFAESVTRELDDLEMKHMFYSIGDFALTKCEFTNGVIELTIADFDGEPKKILTLKPVGWRTKE